VATQICRVVAEALNVRGEPRIQGTIVGTLRRGERVKLVSVSGDGYWYKILGSRGLTGWSSHKFLAPVIASGAVVEGDFPWLPIALAEQGVKEYPGDGDNPRIVEYLQSTILEAPMRNNDETAWCSAFVNWCVERAGYEGTDSAWAKSWLNWGKAIQKPRRGCVVILTREGGGHVGFYMGGTKTTITVLGGNQSDEVNQSNRPKADLLGFRLPANLV
jgi:uncharacterized protein (TIGR02594 family)